MRVKSKRYSIKSHLGLLIFILFVGAVTIAGIGCSSSDNPLITLKSIEVTPTNPSVPLGLIQQFTATGIYSNNSTKDITTQVAWSSSDPLKATIDSSTGLATTVAVGAPTISATHEDITGFTVLFVTDAELVSIEVTPANPVVPFGLTQQFTATGTYTDSSTHDITDQVTLDSSDPSKATISSVGLATTLAVGETTISATFNGVTGATVLFVTDAELVSIEVTPINPSVPRGLTQQFTAMGMYTDSSTHDITDQVTWDSSDPSKATIDSNTGLASTVAVGTTTISATLDGITGSTVLTVTDAELISIEITPINLSVPLGLTQQFTATGTYSDDSTYDITDQVTWNSSAPTVAEIRNDAGYEGLATTVGVSPPSTIISATREGVTGSTVLTVTPAELVTIEITPTKPTVLLDLTQQFTATGIYTDGSRHDITTQVGCWISLDPTVASISNAAGSKGLATTLAVGETTIAATLDGITGSTVLTVTSAELVSIEITPINLSVPLGLTQQFTATGIYSDSSTFKITDQVTWSSTEPSIATISNAAGFEGLATTVAAGETTIGASLGGITGSTLLTVTSAELVSIEITPTNPSVPLCFTQQFAATGRYVDSSTHDITNQVDWSSSVPSIAMISNAAGFEGLATPLAVGETTIGAAFDGITGVTVLTVTDAQLGRIEVTPTNPSVPLGLTQQFTATGICSDSSTYDISDQVTWNSSTPTVATISNAAGSEGLATTLVVGETTIVATFDVIIGSTLLTVTSAELASIEIIPTTPSVPLGFTQQFTAIGIYTDGSTQYITTQVDCWISLNPTVAAMSNAAGSKGLATTLAVGTTTIGTTFEGITGSTVLTVPGPPPPELVSIEVTPVNPSVPLGLTQQFTAMGIYSDNSKFDITTQVTWSSSVPAVATINNAAGFEGLATTLAAGTTTISATLDGITEPTVLTVPGPPPPVLVSIEVTPVNPLVPLGLTQQFTAKGTYTDASTHDITTQVMWDSSVRFMATISNVSGSKGLATTVFAGITTISATLDGITGSTTLTITSDRLVSIEITPINPSVPLGFIQRFIATGIYTNGSRSNITTRVDSWSSSDRSVAIVNPIGGTAVPVAVGQTTISATLDGITGSTVLTVTPAELMYIQISPLHPSVPLGLTQQFTAVGGYSDSSTQIITDQVTWYSSDPSKAVISNAAGSEGLATTVGVGTTTIRATSVLGGITESTVLLVN